MRKFLSIVFAILCVLTVNAGSGKLKFKNLDHNVIINGEKCLVVHFSVDVYGYKDKDCSVAIYIDHPKGTGVKDKNGRYKSADGNVSTMVSGKCIYENTHWDDFVVYIPNEEIHALPGYNTYYIYAMLLVENQIVLDKIYCDKTFSMTGNTNQNSVNKNVNNKSNNKNNNKNNNVVRNYRENLKNGYKQVKVYENGVRCETIYTTCSMCHGSKNCLMCHGSGGSYIGYNYYPCLACNKTGRCSLCTDGYAINSVHWYDATGKEVYLPMQNGGGSSGGSGTVENHNENRHKHQNGVCSQCGGTKVDRTALYENDPSGAAVNTNGHVGYTNSQGNKCPYCGRYSYHVHLKCPKCGYR